jgi:hypothetical protein
VKVQKRSLAELSGTCTCVESTKLAQRTKKGQTLDRNRVFHEKKSDRQCKRAVAFAIDSLCSVKKDAALPASLYFPLFFNTSLSV